MSAPPAWAKGYALDRLHAVRALFASHDAGMTHGQFGAFREVAAAEALAAGSLHEFGPPGLPEGAVVGRITPRASSFRDFTGAPFTVPPGVFYVKRVAWQTPAGLMHVRRLLVGGASSEPLVMEAWQEHDAERALVAELGLTLLAVKIKASSEMRGVYVSDALRDSFDYRATYPPAEALTLGVLPLPLPQRALDDLREQVGRLEGFAVHYSQFGKGDSWAAVALRGFYDDPLRIEKPREMSKKWKSEHADDLGRSPRDTPLRAQLGAVEAVVAAIPHDSIDRLRLMRLAPGGGELQRHADITDIEAGASPGRVVRVHVPLVTNPGVVFRAWDLDGRRLRFNMREDRPHYLDQRKPHTAVNGGDEERIHLVCDVVANDATVRLLEGAAPAPYDQETKQ